MRRLFLLLALCAWATAVRADPLNLSESPANPPDPAFMVTWEQVARLPPWSPNDGMPPPLELNRALEIVRARVHERFPDQEMRIGTVDLRLWTPKIPHYTIIIQYRPKGATGDEAIYWAHANGWRFVVLMDGTVLTHGPAKE